MLSYRSHSAAFAAAVASVCNSDHCFWNFTLDKYLQKQKTLKQIYARHFCAFPMLNYLIASRRPPGQDVLVVGFVAERSRYKTQCKHTSKDLETQAEKIAKFIREFAEKVAKSIPKSTQNGSKTKPRGTRSQSCLSMTPREASEGRFHRYPAPAECQLGGQNPT